MLPFGGQGANQAIEDAGALGALLQGASADDIPHCLNQFEEVRRLRASRVQILSKTRLGKEKDVEGELRHYADPPGAGLLISIPTVKYSWLIFNDLIDVPTSFSERCQHDFRWVLQQTGMKVSNDGRFDVLESCRRVGERTARVSCL